MSGMNKIVLLISYVFLFGSLLTAAANKKQVISKTIDKGWQFQKEGDSNWHSAKVPGSVHNDLWKNDIIGDPYYRDNEEKLQWIDKETWIYQTTFDISNEVKSKANAQLVFHGLDTYADVYLNGTKVLTANNMFRTWNADVKALLQAKNNELKIVFHSPVKTAEPEWDALGYPLFAINDQSELGGVQDKKVSVFTRKAGYHYGWDWGPRLVTSGIWRPVELQAWDNVRIEDVYYNQKSLTEKLANLATEVTLSATKKESVVVKVMDADSDKVLSTEKVKLKKGENKVSLNYQIDNPELWWTLGLGDAHLYQFRVEVVSDEAVIDSQTERIGLRTVELITEEDEIGKSFYIKLNGQPVFMKGTNYIPSDMFMSERYFIKMEDVIQATADGNMNMLRVWGGGVYEDKRFYDLCDEKGILVWQDFMFACSMYPGHEEFIENVRQEAIDNIKRLRNHASVGMWCGNNELEWAWFGWGMQKQFNWSKEDSTTIANDYFKLFTKVLPEVINEYTDKDYWASSPYFRSYGPHLENEGDRHLWDVWKGSKTPEYYKKHVPRFMSEYGFQAYPEMSTIETFTLPEDRQLSTPVMQLHQKAKNGNKRMKKPMYIEMGKGWERNLEDFVYVSQLYQAYDLKFAIETHRRNQPHCMGTLYWQINDVWPTPSWATIDYEGKWKAAHYAVRDAYETHMVSVSKDDGVLNTYVISDKPTSSEMKVLIEVMDFKGNVVYQKEEVVVMKEPQSKKVHAYKMSNLPEQKNNLVMVVTLKNGDIVKHQNLFYLSKQKELALNQDYKLKKSLTKNRDGSYSIELYSESLLKGLRLTSSETKGHFSDNYFDLLPGHTKTITWKAKKVGNSDVSFKISTYNDLLKKKAAWSN